MKSEGRIESVLKVNLTICSCLACVYRIMHAGSLESTKDAEAPGGTLEQL